MNPPGDSPALIIDCALAQAPPAAPQPPAAAPGAGPGVYSHSASISVLDQAAARGGAAAAGMNLRCVLRVRASPRAHAPTLARLTGVATVALALQRAATVAPQRSCLVVFMNCTRIHTCMHKHARTRARTCARARTHAHTYTHTHTHIHTHAHIAGQLPGGLHELHGQAGGVSAADLRRTAAGRAPPARCSGSGYSSLGPILQHLFIAVIQVHLFIAAVHIG
jgi:hypothetical protein